MLCTAIATAIKSAPSATARMTGWRRFTNRGNDAPKKWSTAAHDRKRWNASASSAGVASTTATRPQVVRGATSSRSSSSCAARSASGFSLRGTNSTEAVSGVVSSINSASASGVWGGGRHRALSTSAAGKTRQTNAKLINISVPQ